MGHWHGEYFILLPLGQDEDVPRALNKLYAYFQENNWPFIIRDVEASVVDVIRKNNPEGFKFIEDRGNFDYVYNAQDLIELRGRRYHGKKNHVNTFRNTYGNYVNLPLNQDMVDACIEYETAWFEQREAADDSLQIEKQAVIEALRNFSALKLAGTVIFVDNKVVAFTFGERLNEDTAVVHVEKADPNYKGLYAVINQEFCRDNWQNMKYVNRQEDLGIPGLIKAKQSYHPVKMIEKYIVEDNK
jgi:hypothetical protein